MEAADAYLSGLGYHVVRNSPYAGGFTTENYGRPDGGVHALQIEVNRALYMDELTYARRPGFAEVRTALDGLVGALAEAARTIKPPRHPKAIIREAKDEDVPTIAEIYGYYVANTTFSFEEVPPTVEDMAARRRDVLSRGLPYLVAEVDGHVVGFAYVGPFRHRSAYRYTIEVSIYLSRHHQRKGYGRALMAELIERCTTLGYRQMIAVIGDSENESSQALHASQGFRREGILRGVGLKFGRWIDVVIMHRELAPATTGTGIA